MSRIASPVHSNRGATPFEIPGRLPLQSSEAVDPPGGDLRIQNSVREIGRPDGEGRAGQNQNRRPFHDVSPIPLQAQPVARGYPNLAPAVDVV